LGPRVRSSLLIGRVDQPLAREITIERRCEREREREKKRKRKRIACVCLCALCALCLCRSELLYFQRTSWFFVWLCCVSAHQDCTRMWVDHDGIRAAQKRVDFRIYQHTLNIEMELWNNEGGDFIEPRLLVELYDLNYRCESVGFFCVCANSVSNIINIPSFAKSMRARGEMGSKCPDGLPSSSLVRLVTTVL
jgi:hypothetical protein